MLAILRVKRIVIKRLWEEAMDEGAERHTIVPAGWEVNYVDILCQQQQQLNL